MKKIYLFHETINEYIYDIIDSKFLLSSHITKNKEQNPYDIYLPYIFMNCCMKEDIKYLIPYTFVFSYDILDNRSFYINYNYSAGDIKTSTYFPKNTSKKKIYNSLYNLLEKSKNMEKNLKKNWENKYKCEIFKCEIFTTFQEIFFRKKVNLYDALYIVVPKDVDIKLLDKIKNNLPNIKILYKDL
jgi:hypothetical protein